MFRKTHLFALVFLLAGNYCIAQDKPLKIVLLGSYHLSGMTSDNIRVKSDSILGSKRQKEIKEIVTQLASFNPQHIFVEASERMSPVFQLAYIEFQEGKMPKEKWLAVNEIFQFGIKTANEIKLARGVTPVDWQQPFISDTSKALERPVEEAYRQYWKAVQNTAFDFNQSKTEAFTRLMKPHMEFMSNIPNLPLKETLAARVCRTVFISAGSANLTQVALRF